jgi:peptidylprolyl isomerase
MYHQSIMNFTALLLASVLPAAAQTAATTAKAPTSARTVHHTTATGGCAKLPEMSPTIPALPAGLPCAKPLYTITTQPSARLEYVSPLEGADFAEKVGIQPSTFSLDYVDTKIGTGQPAAGRKYYTIHYTGYLLNGNKFDSSLDRGEPIEVEIGQHQVIMGWDTGFGGMRVGGKRRLFIPWQLAYGERPHGNIPPKSELIFDVELVSVSDTPAKPKVPPTPPHNMFPKPGSPTAPVTPNKSTTPATPGATPAPSAAPAAPAGTPATTSPAGDPTKPTSAPPPTAGTTTPPANPKP